MKLINLERTPIRRYYLFTYLPGKFVVHHNSKGKIMLYETY